MTSVDRIQGLSGGIAIKVPCRVATTANITLSGEQTIDGIAVVDGDRVLVKNQTTGSENGIYEASTGGWTRAPDFDGSNDVVTGTMVLVVSGTVNADTAWRVTTTGTITPGTTSITIAAALTGAVGPTGPTGPAGPTFTGGSVTSDITMTAASIVEVEGAAVTAASSTNIWATDGNTVHVTGNTGINDFATAPQAGAWMKVIFDGTPLLTQSANLNLNAGGANVTMAAGDFALVYADTTTQMDVFVIRKSGTALVSSAPQIQPISASVAANALTISASALSLDFRSATLTSGAVATVSGTPANLVISSGSTLGTVSGTQSRIVVLALNNAGTIELAAGNISGGVNFTETGVITTTAEGGAGAADSATTVYSTTARVGVAYRVLGYIESTQATAGTWATAPSTIQGAGGEALTAMSSIGYGQTWQDVTGSRTFGATYYNTTGKPITVSVTNSLNLSVSVGGVVIGTTTVTANVFPFVFVVPPGQAYVVSGTGSSPRWAELR